MPWAEGLNRDYQNYKYNGKEFIEMHGYDTYDYGARGMYPAIMRFTTIDPLAEKYYSVSPYAYCVNNPVKFIDPDGKDIIIYYKNKNGGYDSYRYKGGSVSHGNKYVQNLAAAWNYNITNGGGDNLFEAALNSHLNISIIETEGRTTSINGNIYWNDKLGLKTTNKIVLSPATALEHEADHVIQRNTNPKQFAKDRIANSDKQYDTKEERRVITGSEQKTAKANGEIKKGEVTRKDHKGTLVVTKSVVSTEINTYKTKEYEKRNRWHSD